MDFQLTHYRISLASQNQENSVRVKNVRTLCIVLSLTRLSILDNRNTKNKGRKLMISKGVEDINKHIRNPWKTKGWILTLNIQDCIDENPFHK